MDKHSAVLDASFWINAHRSGVVDYLLDYFDLVVPTQVMHEIEYMPPDVGQLTPAGETFRRWRQEGRLRFQDPAKPVDWFHPGENVAIGLAQEQGYVLLMDDQPGAISPGKTPRAASGRFNGFRCVALCRSPAVLR